MQENSFLSYVACAVTLLLAVLLQILPLSESLVYWRPQFVLLVVFFWLMKDSFQYGVTFAWLAGLLLDVVVGELLGRYAMVFAFCAYLLTVLQLRLRHFHVLHQAVLVLFLVMLSQLLLHSINLMLRANWQGEMMVYQAVTSALLWPLMAWLLNKLVAARLLNQDISPDH